eukprot:10506911-Alexandrium_andersonii.AAC.1
MSCRVISLEHGQDCARVPRTSKADLVVLDRFLKCVGADVLQRQLVGKVAHIGNPCGGMGGSPMSLNDKTPGKCPL